MTEELIALDGIQSARRVKEATRRVLDNTRGGVYAEPPPRSTGAKSDWRGIALEEMTASCAQKPVRRLEHTTNTVYEVVLFGFVTGGTFTLSDGTNDSDAIGVHVSPSAVQTIVDDWVSDIGGTLDITSHTYLGRWLFEVTAGSLAGFSVESTLQPSGAKLTYETVCWVPSSLKTDARPAYPLQGDTIYPGRYVIVSHHANGFGWSCVPADDCDGFTPGFALNDDNATGGLLPMNVGGQIPGSQGESYPPPDGEGGGGPPAP